MNPLDRGSVGPVLEALGRERRIRYEHERIRRASQFEESLDQWLRRRSYPLGYLAMHGDTGRVYAGRKAIDLEALSQQLSGRCSGKVFFFASCRTFLGGEAKLHAFVTVTGARAVCGYTKSVDMMQAAAFDLLLIDWLAGYDAIKRIDGPFRSFNSAFPGLVERFGFRAYSQASRLIPPG